MVNRERGHTVMELVIAMAVIAVLVGAAVSGGNAHFATVGRGWDELRTTEAAADRLEAIAGNAATPIPGERTFETAVGMKGTESVTEIRPGLFEVRVRVSKSGARPTELTTLVARGGKR